MKKRIIRGCLRIATLAVAGGVLGWLSSILFGERALITELPVVVTLGASIGILSGVVSALRSKSTPMASRSLMTERLERIMMSTLSRRFS